MKLISILGTRPDITKLSPVLPLFDQNFDHKVIHTGQHYDYNMDKVFFEQLQLRSPDFQLGLGAANLSHAQQSAEMMVQIERILVSEKPNWVLVFGDPNTPLAGALVAAKLGIPLIHMEAGCRSFNKRMPEEINRIVCDHCADLLLAPDEVAKGNLLREGIAAAKIHVVGSTAPTAARRNARLSGTHQEILLGKLEVERKKYALLTIHRAENTNDPKILNGLLSAINQVAERIPIVFPIHPRTQKIISQAQLELNPRIRVIPPADYLNFLLLLDNAYFVMSDSGGIQEEAAELGTPCLVLRGETEWTYLIELGKNLLLGTEPKGIVAKTTELLDHPEKLQKMAEIPLKNHGDVAQRIVEVIRIAQA